MSRSCSATTRFSRSTCARSLNPGERTQPLDLQGRARPIKRIEIAARAGHDFRRRAVLTVYAEQVRERENWELLGQQQVGFGVDRDVIRVGRREGRFEKIALEVSGNDIELLDLRVVYFHGPPQDLSVREFIRAGGRTRPLDLIGGDRTIDRIELVYRSRPGFRGQATVAVLRPAGRRRPAARSASGTAAGPPARSAARRALGGARLPEGELRRRPRHRSGRTPGGPLQCHPSAGRIGPICCS